MPESNASPHGQAGRSMAGRLPDTAQALRRLAEQWTGLVSELNGKLAAGQKDLDDARQAMRTELAPAAKAAGEAVATMRSVFPGLGRGAKSASAVRKEATR